MFYHTLDAWSLDESKALINFSSEFYEIIWTNGAILFLFPCFGLPLVSGCSFYLMNQTKTKKQIILRAILLFILGSLVLLSSTEIKDLYNWDILQFISAMTLLSLIVLKNYSYKKNLILIACFIIISFITRKIAYSINDNSDNLSSLVTRAFFGSSTGSSYYSVGVWGFIFILGQYYGFLISNKINSFIKILKVQCILFSFIYILNFNYWSFDYLNVWGSHLYLPSLVDFISILYPVNLLLLLCYYTEKHITNKKIVSLINLFSQNILYIFVAHSMVIFLFIDVFDKSNNYLFLLIIMIQFIFCFFIAQLAQKLKLNK
jgi:hypothetical protein